MKLVQKLYSCQQGNWSTIQLQNVCRRLQLQKRKGNEPETEVLCVVIG